MNQPASSPKPTQPKRQSASSFPSMVLNKPVNPSTLLGELHKLGITGTIRQVNGQSVLTMHRRPATVSSDQIAAVVAKHVPTPASPSPGAQLKSWSQLNASQKDSLIEAGLKKLFQIS